MSKAGIPCARRTVTKYRKVLTTSLLPRIAEKRLSQNKMSATLIFQT